MNPPIQIRRVDRVLRRTEKLAYLENADKISYTLTHNDISECGFRLPANDPKGQHLSPLNYIELRDNGAYIGLFKMTARNKSKGKDGLFYEVKYQHVIRTLTEHVLFSVHDLSSLTVSEVIRRILNDTDSTGKIKQTDWVLDRCEFSNIVIDYFFENCTMFDALMEITKNWTTQVKWDFDTTAWPWKVSLLRAVDDIKSEIRSGKNLVSVAVNDDFDSVMNRIYGLGTGEGINQTNLVNAEDLENPGAPNNPEFYVQDTKSIAKYGLREAFFIDRSVEQKPLLLLGANRILNDYSNIVPVIQVQAIDLYPKSAAQLDRFIPGDICRIIDDELQIDEKMRILQVAKFDMTGQPGAVSLQIGRMANTVLNTIRKIYTKDNADKVCAQGATNIWSERFADNADKDNPITVKFRLPDDLLYVNECILDFDVSNFRAYETGAASGGGGTSGSGNLTTTTSGGGGTSGSGNLSTTNDGGDGTQTSTTTPARPAGPDESDQFPTTIWSSAAIAPETAAGEPVYGAVYPAIGYESPLNQNLWIGKHWHPELSHNHQVVIPMHSHSVPTHNHSTPNHAHNIPSHEHSIPNHVHPINYGIYKELTLAVQGIRVYIDGSLLGTYSLSTGTFRNGINMIGTLKKDANGRVARGVHTIEIYPTASGTTAAGLCRITGAIFIKCFIQSRGSYTV